MALHKSELMTAMGGLDAYNPAAIWGKNLSSKATATVTGEDIKYWIVGSTGSTSSARIGILDVEKQTHTWLLSSGSQTATTVSHSVYNSIESFSSTELNIYNNSSTATRFMVLGYK